MVNTELWTAFLNNIAGILTAVGACATALAGAWVAYKQSQTHTAVTNLQAQYDADHPKNPS